MGLIYTFRRVDATGWVASTGGVTFRLAVGPSGAAGAAGPNSISDSTALGTLTETAAPLFMLSANAAGSLARKTTPGATGLSLLLAANGAALRAILGTGTADATTYLRGDGTWQTVSAGGVSSFNGRTGAVVPVSGDYTAAQVTNAADKTAANTFTAQNTFAAGTITTSRPHTLSQTWNSAGVTFEGMLIDITSTASAGASMPFNIKVGGSSIFSVRRDGTATIGPAAITNASMSGTTSFGGWYQLRAAASTDGLFFGSGHRFCWGSGSTNTSGAGDTALVRSAAGVVGVYDNAAGGAGTAVSLRFQRASSTTAQQSAGDITSTWNANDGAAGTHATRSGDLILSAYTTTTAQEGFRISAAAAGVRLGFYAATPTAKQTVTGSRGGGAALADLLTKLATLGLITDSTTA